MTILETILPVNTGSSAASTTTNNNNQRINNWKRTNGLQLPWDIQQILGWFALFFLLLSSFYILLPSLGNELKAIWLCIFGSLCFLHIVSHIAALLIDPSDPELLLNNRKSCTTTPEYDPNRHLHVIEHGRCHICNIRASGPRTKHCRCCNKCIEKFDHHCKWLNNCIGCRNYVAFIISVISAALSCHVILITAVWILATQMINPNSLDEIFNTNVFYNTFNNDDFISQILPLPDIPLKCILVIQIVLSFIAAGLLTHLCLFHIYISILGVTTYEYIRKINNHNNAKTNTTIPDAAAAAATNNGSATTVNVFDKQQINNEKDETCVNNFFICYAKNDKNKSNLNVSMDESSFGNNSTTTSRSLIESPIDTITDRTIIQDNRNNIPLMYCEHCKTWSPLTLYPLHHQQQQFVQTSSRLRCCAATEQHNRVIRTNRINPITPTDCQNTNHIYVKPRRSSSLNSLPSLPPPPRRQIQSVSLKELNEMLTYAQRPQTVRLRRTNNNVIPIRSRQLRRKSNPQLKPFLSAHLSPIHESGLSNPSTPHLKDKTHKVTKTNPSPLAQ